MKKKILFVDHTPFVGGAELALASHIKHLDKDRFEPLVACSAMVPSLVRDFEAAGAKVFVIPFEQLKVFSPTVLIRFARGVWGILGVLKNEKVDLVVTNTERAMYVGTLAAILSRKKLIWWVRDFGYNRALFRLLLRFPQKIICVSEAVREYYGGQENPKFEVVYVGSDFDEKLKDVSLEDVLRVKEELGLLDADLVVGFVGRLVEWKGPQVLVQAAKELKGTKGLKVVIVGSGEGQKGNIEPQLHQMIKELRLEDQIVLTGHRQDVPVLMKAFDVFCHTSIEPEPFATVVVEAMMAGVPVIGTSTGGTPEVIRNSQTGFLVPPNDPATLAVVLSYLARDQKLRRRVGEQGRYVAQNSSSETKTTPEAEKVISEVMRL